MVSKAYVYVKQRYKFDWLTSRDGYLLRCNKILCQM